jgi:hypothetical protein
MSPGWRTDPAWVSETGSAWAWVSARGWRQARRDGVGVGVGDGVGALNGARPARIGKIESALMMIVLPRIWDTRGVMSEKLQVKVTCAGMPRSVPLGKTGSGRIPGRLQFRAFASARIWSL